MTKWIPFLKKRFTAAGEIDVRVGLLLLLISLVVIAGSVLDTTSEPSRQRALLSTQPAPALSEPTLDPEGALQPSKTPLPPEYLMNQQQTIGLTFAAAALVLVVVIGVLAAFIQNPGDL